MRQAPAALRGPLRDGVALLALDQTDGAIVGRHKASFIAWVGATSLQVLAHALDFLRSLRPRVAGAGLRFALLGGALAAGVVLAVATLPAADRLQDRASAHIGLDPR